MATYGDFSVATDNPAEYERILQDLEELESIRAYDAAKASGDEAIPFEKAVAEIEERLAANPRPPGVRKLAWLAAKVGAFE